MMRGEFRQSRLDMWKQGAIAINNSHVIEFVGRCSLRILPMKETMYGMKYGLRM